MNEKAFQMRKAYLLNPAEIINTKKYYTFYKRHSSVAKQRSIHSQMRIEKDKQLQQLVSEKKINALLQNTNNLSDVVIPSLHNAVKDSSKNNIKGLRLLLKPSPYISNSLDFNKIVRLMSKIKGPTESVKLQIKKHNYLNIINAEHLICKKTNGFQERMKKYVNRLQLNQDTKIFIMNSRDIHIKQVLLKRGWVQSTNKQSALFHLKWVYKDQPSDYHLLQEGQLYNHFLNNQQLTNKNLLQKNIKKAKIKTKPLIPLSFDLDVNQDQIAFNQQFSKREAVNTLFYIQETIKEKFPQRYKKTLRNIFFFTNQKIRLKSQQQQNISHKKDHNKNQERQKQIKQATCINFFSAGTSSKKKYHELLYKMLSPNIIYSHLYKLICFLTRVVQSNKNIVYSVFFLEQLNNIGRSSALLLEANSSYLNNLTQFYIVEIIKLSIALRKIYENNPSNVWIMKPTGVSRGTGITLSNCYTKILQNKHGKFVQKYIENPLILHNKRKFDIRQWVLVLSFEPLIVLSSQEYLNTEYDNLLIHLTNYSQNKETYLKNKCNSSVIQENKFKEQIGEEKWINIKKKIEIIILRTLQCCKKDIVQRQQCFEIYGFDLLVDSLQQVWLLQVNLSPACDNREPFLEQNLRNIAEDTINILQRLEPKYWKLINKFQIECFQKEIEEKKKKILAAHKIYRFVKQRFTKKKFLNKSNEKI